MQQKRISRRAGTVSDGLECAEYLSGAVCKMSRLEKIAPVHTRIAECGRKTPSPIVPCEFGIDKGNTFQHLPLALYGNAV